VAFEVVSNFYVQFSLATSGFFHENPKNIQQKNANDVKFNSLLNHLLT